MHSMDRNKITKIDHLINLYARRAWGDDLPGSFWHWDFLDKLKEKDILHDFYRELIQL